MFSLTRRYFELRERAVQLAKTNASLTRNLAMPLTYIDAFGQMQVGTVGNFIEYTAAVNNKAIEDGRQVMLPFAMLMPVHSMVHMDETTRQAYGSIVRTGRIGEVPNA